MEMESRELINNAKLAAFTGHRELRPEDVNIIADKLALMLKDLGIKRLLVGNAEGADRIAKEIAKELGISVYDLDTLVVRAKGMTDTDYYSQQADYMVENTSCLIAVWDGIFTIKPGGTSDIVHKALNSQKQFSIHHLVCPRQTNPYPVASILNNVIDFKNSKFSRIPFAVPFSWVHHQVNTQDKTSKKLDLEDNQFRTSYMIPGIFAILTLMIGFAGFSYIYPYDLTNNFFRSINLITFNNSVIEGKPAGFLLHIARLFGFLAATTALGFAIWAATEKQRKLLKLRKLGKNGDFDLVLGINQKSYDLIVDLHQQNHKNIVVVHPQGDNKYLLEIKKFSKVITVEGNLFSGTTLKSVFAHKAKNIYIMGESDTENIRAAHETDLIFTKNKLKSTGNTFVHLEDENKKLLLINSLSGSFKEKTSIFNTYENIVRRLQLYFPIDRFYQNPDSDEAHAIIIGFENLGKTLAVYLLKQGHYSRTKKLFLKIYCTNALVEKEKFLKTYPQFDIHAFGSIDYNSNIMAYTWANISLEFFEMPSSDKDWLADQNPIFSAINKNNIVNIYACLPDGIMSASYLGIILPKIEILKNASKANVQVFCYYNYPDKKEEAIIEDYLNRLAPFTFIKCFGNFLDECSANFIHDISLDALPKLINASYSQSDGSPETLWAVISEKDKISNRQAADHLWSKIRLIWPKIDWKFNPKTFEPFPEVAEQIFQDSVLEEYGEMEHRRWCADLLLQGFVPFDLKFGSAKYLEIAEKWKDKTFKREQQIQKKHISLVPYVHLTTIDQAKDIDQIKAIPGLLRGVVKT